MDVRAVPPKKEEIYPTKFHVFVGTESGLLKGVDCESESWNNLNSLQEVERKNEIVSMYWDNADQTKICVGRRCKRLDFYDLKESRWQDSVQLGGEEEGVLKAALPVGRQIVTGEASGLVQLWKKGKQQASTNTGAHLYCMCQRHDVPNVIATGGKESDAKIWDLHSPDTPVFSAKNVRNDWLDLRVPVWVRGVVFVPQSDKLLTCTSYHQVRMYDPSSPQRRPVMDIQYGDLPLVSIAILPSGQQVVVGNGNGDIGLLDLRKACLVQSYKGSSGAVRCIQSHVHGLTIATCGLDRYMRVYDVQSKALLHKLYLKSRLNCLLYRDEAFSTKVLTNKTTGETIEEDVDRDDSMEEDDELWNSLENVSRTKKRKSSTTRTKMTLRRSKRNKEKVV